MNAAQQTVSLALSAADQMLNMGSLVIYSGTQPSTPESALSGNTALVTFTFSASAFAAPTFSASNMQSAASFVSSSVAPSASGTAAFARATVWPWTASTAVAVGQYAVNGGNLYQATVAGTTASSGGPSGTTGSITDGTATWKYVAATNTAAGQVVTDYTVGTSGTDIVIGSTTISTGVNVSISSFVHKMPAV